MFYQNLVLQDKNHASCFTKSNRCKIYANLNIFYFEIYLGIIFITEFTIKRQKYRIIYKYKFKILKLVLHSSLMNVKKINNFTNDLHENPKSI